MAVVRQLALVALVVTGCARRGDDRPYIRSMTLDGVHNVDRRHLRNGLASAPTPWWSFRRRRPYDELALEADRERIVRYYQAHGYYAAAVTRAEAVPRADGKSVDVRFAVDEGPETRIDALRLNGAGEVDVETKHAVDQEQLALRRGQVFEHARYLALKDGLLAVLKNSGYAWAELDGDVVVDRSRNTADVELTLDPGERVTIGRVEIEPGAPHERLSADGRVRFGRASALSVDPRLIAQAFGVAPGARFRLADLEDGRGRVLSLGLFGSVGLSYHRDAERPGVVDVQLRLGDASLHELRLGGGIGVEALRNEVRLSLQYTRRNFLGGLRTLEVRLRPAYVVVPAVWTTIARHGPAATADVIFTQPRLGFLSKLQWTVGYDLGVEYAYQFHGPRTQLAVWRLLWKDRVALGVSYNFQFLDFFATAPQILADPAQAGAMFGYVDPYRLGWYQEEAHLDLRDDRLEPRRGFYAEVVGEQGGIYAGGAFTYEKIRAGARGYAPLGHRVVLAARFEFGQIFSQGAEGSPITRRLYLGGPASHRGFSEGRLSPQIAVPGGSPLPIGGDQSVLVSGELRVDMVRLGGSWLAAAAFCDAGDVGAASGETVSGARRGVDWARLHTAVGGGVRYRTPIGVARVDVGVRVNRVGASEADGTPNPDPGQRVAFHISLAEAF